MHHKRWTPEETERARELLAANATDAEIHREIGRTRMAALLRVRWVDGRRSGRWVDGRRSGLNAGDPVTRVPPELLSDAERRRELRLQRTDPTAELFGDPLPGYSELDKRCK